MDFRMNFLELEDRHDHSAGVGVSSSPINQRIASGIRVWIMSLRAQLRDGADQCPTDVVLGQPG